MSLNLSKRPEGGLKVSRVVKEDMTKKVADAEIQTQKKSKISYSEDTTLQVLDQSLKQFEKEFGKTSAEIAEVFCLVSGRVAKVREYLQYEKNHKETGSKVGS